MKWDVSWEKTSDVGGDNPQLNTDVEADTPVEAAGFISGIEGWTELPWRDGDRVAVAHEAAGEMVMSPSEEGR